MNSFSEFTEYIDNGKELAMRLDNRGSLSFTKDGRLSEHIIHSYREHGFFILENVISKSELKSLRDDFQLLLSRAPTQTGKHVDIHGKPAIGYEFEKQTFFFDKPLSDPLGGTGISNNRYPVKMPECIPPNDAPEHVISFIAGPLQLQDSFLRLYGHHSLLTVASELNGSDFTPFTEAIIVKPAELGSSVAWHQDGTTLWSNPNWDPEIQGFNFMVQLYGSTAVNGVWVIPGSHKKGKVDISELVKKNDDSALLPDAIPIICNPGDVVIANRQTVHGSFANTSSDRRVTINMGFHRRSAVHNVQTTYNNKLLRYDDEYIYHRAKIIQLAIDARYQKYPHEPRFVYEPFLNQEHNIKWDETARKTLLKNYNLMNIGI